MKRRNIDVVPELDIHYDIYLLQVLDAATLTWNTVEEIHISYGVDDFDQPTEALHKVLDDAEDEFTPEQRRAGWQVRLVNKHRPKEIIE